MVQDTYQNGVRSALFVSCVFYPILLWFTYALFIQANPVQVGPGPPESAQVLPGPRTGNPQPFPPRFSEEIPETPQNNTQVLPGNPGNATKS